MTNIDFSRVITEAQKAQEARAPHTAAVKADCRRRILAVADLYAQVNVASRIAAGLLTDDEKAAYGRVLDWIAEMRAVSDRLEADTGARFADDAAWPAPPAEAVALMARF